MAEAARRVALLARPGTACDNLQAALRQAGAEVVVVVDPVAGDAGSVAGARADAVLVALEPAVEDVLDRYDAFLLDPAMTVIYDEADLAAKRDGWDAARWTRHLAAKLAGHQDVLPPGAGTDEGPAQVAFVQEPVARIEPRIEPSLELVPGPESVREPEPASDASPASAPEPDAALDFDLGLDLDMEAEPAPIALDEAIRPDGVLSLDDLDFEFEPAPAAEATSEASAAASAAAPAAAAESRPSFDFSALSLEEIAVESPAEPTPTPQADALPEPTPTSGIPVAIDAPAHPGGVVVLAGIGGPDAVRQFLAALPLDFPRPVLVRQRLDGGRHDRLVRQMQRATSLPVQLAEAGAPVAPGHVYVLPDAMSTAPSGQAAHHFLPAADPVPVLAGLPAADSAILMLSGSDPAMVEEVRAAAGEGALVAGQSPDECFDSEAPAALMAGGADSGTPADLAARLSARWPT